MADEEEVQSGLQDATLSNISHSCQYADDDDYYDLGLLSYAVVLAPCYILPGRRYTAQYSMLMRCGGCDLDLGVIMRNYYCY